MLKQNFYIKPVILAIRMKEIYLIILSLIGFAVSFYIYYTKAYHKKMFCVIGEGCDAVVKSRYGKTFGMENTIPGMLYYALIFFYGSFLMTNRNIFKGTTIYYLIVIASIGSVLFSLYLAYIQKFVLKKWCE